jgi:hypothetical protein
VNANLLHGYGLREVHFPEYFEVDSSLRLLLLLNAARIAPHWSDFAGRSSTRLPRNPEFTQTAHSAQGDICRSSLRGSGRLGEPETYSLPEPAPSSTAFTAKPTK